MSVDRSPVPGGEPVDIRPPNYPTQKLGALTRKKNEIEVLMNQKADIKTHHKEYEQRLINFNQACKIELDNEDLSPDIRNQFTEWYNRHREEADSFDRKVVKWLQQIDDPSETQLRPDDSASQVGSNRSRSSGASGTSSLRAKLAQQRAQRKADESVVMQKRQLEQEQRRLKHLQEEEQRHLKHLQEEKDAEYAHKLEDLERKRALHLEKNLEEELEFFKSNQEGQSATNKTNLSENNLTRRLNKIGSELPIQNPYFDEMICSRNSHVKFKTSHEQIKSNLETSDPTHERINGGDQLTEILIKQNDISNKLLMSHDRASLPKQEPETFDGLDVTRYRSFIQCFERTIESKIDNNLDRLFFLEKYTSGLPLQLVKGCRTRDPTRGYEAAKTILEKEFGNEYLISNAYLEKINSWKPIKSEDGKNLREFSIFLRSCANLMDDISPLNQLNSPSEIMKIVHKLPYKMRDGWRRKVQRINEENRKLRFMDLCQFIHKESDLINQPLFGDIVEKIKDEKNQLKKSNFSPKKKAFSTVVENSKFASAPPSCVVCSKTNHQIKTCFFFKKKNYDDKIKFIKDKRLCFSCLGRNHMSNTCTKKEKCDKCSGSHPTMLHKEKEIGSRNITENSSGTKTNTTNEATNKTSIETPSTSAIETPSTSATSFAHVSQNTGAGIRTISPAIPVRIKAIGSEETVITYMGIDPYCSDVFMSKKLASSLGISGKSSNIQLSTMHSTKAETTIQIVNNLEIYDLDENERATIPIVYCKEEWPFSKKDSPSQRDLDNYPFLSEIPFKFIDEEIGLLVGINQPHIIKVLKTVDGPDEKGPYATLHKFGWAFNGPVVTSTERNRRCHLLKVDDMNKINEEFKQLCAQDFKDDHNGILSASIEDIRWENKVKATMNKGSDNHYEVELPFREDSFEFPHNKEQVLNRLLSSHRRLKKDEAFYKEYKAFMDLMLENEFAELIPAAQLKTEPGKVWYLVHFGIYHKQKNKLRVVFDASLKYKGVSLNDALLQGPDLTNNLLGVLLRFRQETIGITADIRKMFYMVRVPVHHRDYLRFWWYPDGKLDQPPMEYRVTVHVFGAISSPSVANHVLRHTANTEEASKFSQEARDSISKNFYVDDFVKSTNEEGRAIKLLKEVTDIVSTGGFHLTGVVSSCRAVLNSVSSIELSPSFIDLDLSSDDLPIERALGVTWDVEKDEIGFRLNLPPSKDTRRGILSIIFSLYDPFGLAAPVILPAKRIFQRTCHENLKWDEPLPEELLTKWKAWQDEVRMLADYRIQRCYKHNAKIKTIQLHIFCDGSEVAYAAVAYLQYIYEDGDQPSCSFVMSKTRLVPIKGTALTTIPRIELNGAKLAVQVYQILKNELETKFQKCHFWTDSTTVLKYINSTTGRFQRFVSNRVTFIRNHSSVENWRHVPGDLNPADMGSRGVSTIQFLKSQTWKFGPHFLQKKEEFWPSTKNQEIVKENDPEIKKGKIVMTTQIETVHATDKLLQSSSTWFKTKVKVAWILRLKNGLKNKVWKNNSLNIYELREAELTILKYLQNKYFVSTIERLKTQGTLLQKDELIKLHPFLDNNGLLRVGGRISRAETSFEIKHPIILPKNDHVINLIVEEIHILVGHLGKECMLSEIRKKYWIIGANNLSRKIVRKCLPCRKRQGRPGEQIMADLPEERLTADLPAFLHVGIDCFGPFLVVRGRAKEKRYGVIFTCLASRAVHIEVVFTLEADSFISALRRFSSRRGSPKIIRSDNGTNFVGAEKELRISVEIFNSKHMQDYVLQKGINWKFQPPAASHFGGIWEREIRTIRKVLSALTNEQPLNLNDESLCTLMCEVENILNSRPITAISDDPNDFEALTPNHLLLARSEVIFPCGLFMKSDLYAKRRWRQIQYLSDLFWTRWKKEFLPLLQERQKWTKDLPSHEVGDLVLVVDQLLPRNQWSLGRIVKLISDKNGRVRIADIKIAKIKGELKPGTRITVIQRPIVKLVSLRSVKDL